MAVYIVAPSDVNALDWLATDEGQANREAATRVLAAEWLLDGISELGGEAGDADPVLAITDALQRFPADEIVVVGNGRPIQRSSPQSARWGCQSASRGSCLAPTAPEAGCGHSGARSPWAETRAHRSSRSWPRRSASSSSLWWCELLLHARCLADRHALAASPDIRRFGPANPKTNPAQPERRRPSATLGVRGPGRQR